MWYVWWLIKVDADCLIRNINKVKSQIFILLISIRFGLFKKDSPNYFKLSFLGRLFNSADLDLSLERAILPIIIFILIVSWHLELLFTVLVNQLKIVSSEKWLSVGLVKTFKNPIVIYYIFIITIITLSPSSKCRYLLSSSNHWLKKFLRMQILFSQSML